GYLQVQQDIGKPAIRKVLPGLLLRFDPHVVMAEGFHPLYYRLGDVGVIFNDQSTVLHSLPSSRSRQDQRHRRAFVLFAVDPQAAAVGSDESPGIAQAESCTHMAAAGAARQTLPNLVEAGRRNALAGVLN